jgi:hypothetical protein
MGEVIRWHDHDKAARCWATEAKYRRMIANGLVPPPVIDGDELVDLAPCEYVAPMDDPE